jgi:FAD/FMN-containing dehydrogenase
VWRLTGRQIIVSLERMDRIREVDPVSMSISVDAGAILKNVQDAAATAGLLLPLSLGAKAVAGSAATSERTPADCPSLDTGCFAIGSSGSRRSVGRHGGF